jgi:hypothetical protein
VRKILVRLSPFLRLMADSEGDEPRITILGPSDRPGNYGYDIVLNIETEDGNEWAIPVSQIIEAATAAGGEE